MRKRGRAHNPGASKRLRVYDGYGTSTGNWLTNDQFDQITSWRNTDPAGEVEEVERAVISNLRAPMVEQ